MIVPEEILKEIFTQLPPAKDSNNVEFPVRFSWGEETDLNPYLLSLQGARYPLIWLVSGTDEAEYHAHCLRRKCRLLIAKKSEDANELNPSVWQDDFANVLNPILKNMVTAIEKSGVTKILGGKARISRRANYTESRKSNGDDKTKSPAIDLWNVILWEGEIEFHEKANGEPICINTIRF